MKAFFLDNTPPMAYPTFRQRLMVFVETPIFTRQVQELLSDEQYRDLQDELRKYPDAGAKIRGSAGLRKLRWVTEGQGKSGGVRVISYWTVAQDRIFMVY